MDEVRDHDADSLLFEALHQQVRKGGRRQRMTARLPAVGNKHEKPCPACNGAGWVWGTVVNRKTGSRDPHKETCPGCGGTGRG